MTAFCSGMTVLLLPAASFQLTEITRDTNTVTVKWSAEAAKTYEVQSATFVDGPWRPRASVEAVTTRANWAATEPAPVTQQFYRVAMSTNSSGVLPREGLFAGDFIPKNATLVGEQGGAIGANAVFLASQLGAGGAQLVTTGTLTQLGQNWNYGPSPNDRLLVQFATGTNVTFYITRMQGDFSIDPTAFLLGNHNFDYRIVIPGESDLTFTSEIGTGNPTFRASALGTLTWSNVTYSIDLTLSGQHSYESDATGSSQLNDYTMTGKASAPGYSLAVDQRRRYERIVAKVNFGGATRFDNSSSDQDWNNNTLTLGSDVYTWANAQKQKSFKNDVPSSVGTYWQAAGGILKNGAPFGLYKFDTGSVFGYVKFNLVLPNEVIELESWRL